MMDFFLVGYIVALLVGIVLLWWSGDLAVDFALEVAQKFGWTNLFSGFVIMAVSTGIPELAVALSAIWSNAPQISAGDIIGSNVVDITLVLGVVALVARRITVRKRDYANIIMMLLIAALAMINIFFLGVLSKSYGIFLILLYITCLWLIWQTGMAPHVRMKKLGEESAGEAGVLAPIEEPKRSFLQTRLGVILKFVASMILVLLSSEIVVCFALILSKAFGMSLETVGTTVIAIGTSLPELSLGVSAVRKKEYSLALGNCLGSVLEQGTLILGLLAFLSPEPINVVPLRNIAPFMMAAFGVIGFGIIKRKKINRIEGIILLVIFALFIGYQLLGIKI